MGTIIPNGTVYLFKGVPLDNKYNDTLYNAYDSSGSYISNQAEQVNRFQLNFSDYLTYTKFMYQRINDGVLRVRDVIANVYNCNYMIFLNAGKDSNDNVVSNYPAKYFFAFVNKVEYVNEQAVNIYYEIDVFQTYCFDWTLEPCLIERTHVTTDAIGDNKIAEPIDIGKLICQKKETIGYAGGQQGADDWFDHNRIVVFVAESTDEDQSVFPTGFLLGGIYTGLRYTDWSDDEGGVYGVSTYLNTIVKNNEVNKVVSIVMCPQGFIPNSGSSPIFNARTQSFHVSRVTSGGNYSLDGYEPKNKKLLTSPYCMFTVDVQTDHGTYAYELFDSIAQGTNTYNFNCRCSLSPNPEILVQPVNYDGNSGYNQIDGSLIMDSFPQCAFAVDSYRAWLAQNSGNYKADMAGKFIGAAAGAAVAAGSIATGNPAGFISGTATVLNNAVGLAQSQHNLGVEASRGDTARGVQGSSTALGTHQRAIIVKHMCVKYEYAKMIDDFFTRFGYAVGTIATPNLAARKAFTYIKTNGSSVRGKIPADDLAKINSCFDRGITFFKSIVNVGDYSVDNTL